VQDEFVVNPWSPNSWQRKPIRQGVEYADPDALRDTLAQLKSLPPLVTSWEVEQLKQELALAARGERFLLQGGDCSEAFDDCRPDTITAKLKILLKMSLCLVYGTRRQVIRVGRMAGQYAKPRSQQTETRDGTTLPSYRGLLINRPEFTPEAREPDPRLLLAGYRHAALTLNFVRSLIDAGFADLRHPELWDLAFVDYARQPEDYHRIMRSIGDSMCFLEAISGRSLGELRRVEFYTSHEGLHLDYEQAQTRLVPRRTGWYNLTTHMPWIGDRTRNLDGAHVEYFRGIANPIGVKIGPSIDAGELAELIDILDPHDEPGRLTLVHRFGAAQIAEHLPPLLDSVCRAGRQIVWCCDPMHGNTVTTQTGRKTRNFDDILAELTSAMEIHERMGSTLAGVHFELTGENVTECLGGARGLSEADLERAYLTDVDPRLNYEQALEMALLVARHMSRNHGV
jgi:3-deoxy-7-phosphoheptulonate synthase